MNTQEPRSKRQRELTTVEDFYRVAKEVQRRSGQKLCSDGTEDRRFRDYFGTSVHVAIIAWSLLVQTGKLPNEDDGPRDIEHFLWAMYFLANYPTTQVGCAAAGTAEKGAVDPKTWRKYIWPWIYSLADLEDDVVSSFVCFNVVSSHNSPYAFRSFSRTGESILQVIRILALIARIAASLRRVGSLRPSSSKGSRQCVTRWLWES